MCKMRDIGFLISTILSLALVILIPDMQLLSLLILLGQAHFFIAYFYSNKAGKIDSAYIRRFSTYFVIFFTLSVYILTVQTSLFPVFVLFTLILFVIHYVNDEFKLSNFTSDNQILLTSSIAFFFLPTIYNKLLHNTPVVNWISVATGTLLLVAYFWKNTDALKKILSDIQVLVFVCLNVVAITMLNNMNNVSIVQISGFIILFHYIRWYIYYFYRLSGKEREFYLQVIFSIHILILSMFVLYTLDVHNVLLVYFFHPVFFYMWTTIHILVSIRPNDYKLPTIWK